MSKETYHPNAYLPDFRNVKLGLRVRSKILNFLENVITADAETIAKNSGLSYNVVIHHLKLLENQRIVSRRGRRPSLWYLTGFGQRRLQ